MYGGVEGLRCEQLRIAAGRVLLFLLLGALTGAGGFSFPLRSSGLPRLGTHLGQNDDRFVSVMREGQSAFNQNRLREAAGHFQEAVLLRPDSADAQFRLGIALAATGRFAEAYTQLKTAESLSPSTVDILVARAQVEASLQEFRAARQTISRGRSLVSIDLRLDLLELQIDLEEQKLSQGFEKVERISRQYQDHAPILGRLGLVLLGAGFYEEAAARLWRAHQLDSSQPAYALALGEAWLELGKFEETGDLLMALRPQLTGNPDFHRLLARANLERKDYPAAEREIQQALARDADNLENHLLLGSVRLGVGRTREGLSVLKEVLMTGADSPEVHDRVVSALVEGAESSTAQQFMSRLLAVSPDHPLFLSDLVKLSILGGDKGEARHYLRRLSRLNLPRKAIHLELGQFLFEQQEQDLALGQFLRSGTEIHSAPEAKLELAILQSQGGAYSGALRHALEILKNEAARPDLKGAAATVAGISYLNTKQKQRAIEHLQLGVRLAPEVERNYLVLAELFRDGQEFPEAIEILERGCKAIPDSTDLVSHLGRTYSVAGDYERATAVLRQLIVRNPSQVEAYLPLAQAYESLGQVDKAIQVLQARNEFPPPDVMVSTAMAGFLFRKGEPYFEQVLAELEEAEQIRASDPDIYLLRGRVYRAQERYEAAIKALYRALELDPLSQSAHYQLALAYRDAGRPELSFRRFEILQLLTAEKDSSRSPQEASPASQSGVKARSGDPLR